MVHVAPGVVVQTELIVSPELTWWLLTKSPEGGNSGAVYVGADCLLLVPGYELEPGCPEDGEVVLPVLFLPVVDVARGVPLVAESAVVSGRTVLR